MRHALRTGLTLCTLAGASCGSPSSPDLSLDQAIASQVNRHVLTITAAASCPNAGQGTLFTRTFDFEMTMTSGVAGFFSLKMPAGPLISGPNSGELRATFAPGVGILSGSGLAGDGVHNVGFGSRTTLPLEGSAVLFVSDGTDTTQLNGLMHGMISMSVYKSSAGGFCYADNHTWKLRPK